MTALTFGSLFSGFGGFDLGFERAGMVCEWQIEIDDYCSRVLAKHWPDVRRYKDVRECGSENLKTVDVICGGFPCQPHSVAGQRKGESDDRNLWPDYLRIIKESKPRWVVGENVPGLRTTMLDQVLSDLESEGYTTTTLNLPAIAFDAPHIRERLFIVAHATAQRLEGAEFQRGRIAKREWTSDAGSVVADATSSGRETCSPNRMGEREQKGRLSAAHGSWWEVEPRVGRVVDGISSRLERTRAKRLKGLGNAVVPQMAEWIARIIVNADTLVEAAEAGGVT